MEKGDIIFIDARYENDRCFFYVDIYVDEHEIRQLDINLSDLLTLLIEQKFSEYNGDTSGLIFDIAKGGSVIYVSKGISYQSANKPGEQKIPPSLQLMGFFDYYEHFEALIDEAIEVYISNNWQNIFPDPDIDNEGD